MKRNISGVPLHWKDKKPPEMREFPAEHFYKNYSSTSVPSPSARIAGFEELFKCLFHVSHILGTGSLIRRVHR